MKKRVLGILGVCASFMLLLSACSNSGTAGSSAASQAESVHRLHSKMQSQMLSLPVLRIRKSSEWQLSLLQLLILVWDGGSTDQALYKVSL